jgi:hypothetical protein
VVPYLPEIVEKGQKKWKLVLPYFWPPFTIMEEKYYPERKEYVITIRKWTGLTVEILSLPLELIIPYETRKIRVNLYEYPK